MPPSAHRHPPDASASTSCRYAPPTAPVHAAARWRPDAPPRPDAPMPRLRPSSPAPSPAATARAGRGRRHLAPPTRGTRLPPRPPGPPSGRLRPRAATFAGCPQHPPSAARLPPGIAGFTGSECHQGAAHGDVAERRRRLARRRRSGAAGTPSRRTVAAHQTGPANRSRRGRGGREAEVSDLRADPAGQAANAQATASTTPPMTRQAEPAASGVRGHVGERLAGIQQRPRLGFPIGHRGGRPGQRRDGRHRTSQIAGIKRRAGTCQHAGDRVAHDDVIALSQRHQILRLRPGAIEERLVFECCAACWRRSPPVGTPAAGRPRSAARPWRSASVPADAPGRSPSGRRRPAPVAPTGPGRRAARSASLDLPGMLFDGCQARLVRVQPVSHRPIHVAHRSAHPPARTARPPVRSPGCRPAASPPERRAAFERRQVGRLHGLLGCGGRALLQRGHPRRQRREIGWRGGGRCSRRDTWLPARRPARASACAVAGGGLTGIPPEPEQRHRQDEKPGAGQPGHHICASWRRSVRPLRRRRFGRGFGRRFRRRFRLRLGGQVRSSQQREHGVLVGREATRMRRHGSPANAMAARRPIASASSTTVSCTRGPHQAHELRAVSAEKNIAASLAGCQGSARRRRQGRTGTGA